ncbi:MAG: diaminopimelate decarboxylase [Alphaproteobacteria bacterium]|nr:diaminopimelate decarboxylase [Alphaproteobacteria bacterium]
MKIENIELSKIVQQVGTPVYVYSKQKLTEQFSVFKKACEPLKKSTICFAVKSNSNPAVVKTLAQLGAGADIVSGNELRLALHCGIPANKIVYSGVGKTTEELSLAISQGIKQINAESVAELETISELAKSLKKHIHVGIRINPNVDAKTHAKITTGLTENKFGIDFSVAKDLFLRYVTDKYVDLSGIEVHVGSQILSLDPFVEMFEKIKAMLAVLKQQGTNIKTIDFGGGIGVPYSADQTEMLPFDYVEKLISILGNDFDFVFEPGRFISGNAGILATKVLRTKTAGTKKFAIVDAGMNDLMRPALYDAYHHIVADKGGDLTEKYDVAGPICESSDVFGTDRALPELKAGDILAILTAGAYGSVMGSTYNFRPMTAEVFVDGDTFKVVRKRQSFEEMMAVYSEG